MDPLPITELKWSEYRKVPVALVNGKQLTTGSKRINDHLDCSRNQHTLTASLLRRCPTGQWR